MGDGEFRAHGLLGSMVSPDWPPLTLEEANRVLLRYPQARGAVRLVSRSPRPFSSAGVVESPVGQVFLKRHALSVRNKEGLFEEHRFIAYLAAAGDRLGVGDDGSRSLVQRVLANDEGETVLVKGEWAYEVHPVAWGTDVYVDSLSWTPFLNVSHACEAGRAMARLHLLASQYDAPRRADRQLVSSFTIFARDLAIGNPVVGMERYLEHRPLLRRYAEQRQWRQSFDDLLLPLFAELSPWLGSLKPLWTHNDFHSSNLMWTNDSEQGKVSSVIDFGLADRTHAVHDLATAIERNIIEWLRIGDATGKDFVHLDQLDALLGGYEESGQLSSEEARALVAMLPLVHCEFALSETDYFLSVLHSEEKASLAYEGYFLAHAQWFMSPSGKQLMDHLNRWVEGFERRSVTQVGL